MLNNYNFLYQKYFNSMKKFNKFYYFDNLNRFFGDFCLARIKGLRNINKIDKKIQKVKKISN